MKTARIVEEDVLAVAEDLGITLTETELNWVLDCYEDTQRQDPMGTWDLVVEDLIYQAVEFRKKIMEKKLYRTVIRFEVLSDEPIDIANMNLSNIVNETIFGGWSGNVQIKTENEVIRGRDAVLCVLEHGTDPEFFGMDNDGNETDYDTD